MWTAAYVPANRFIETISVKSKLPPVAVQIYIGQAMLYTMHARVDFCLLHDVSLCNNQKFSNGFTGYEVLLYVFKTLADCRKR